MINEFIITSRYLFSWFFKREIKKEKEQNEEEFNFEEYSHEEEIEFVRLKDHF